ncbi:MAG: sugar phosphate isomerase/epimerase [Fimbriimonadaceae bacterium]|nr:sugar phosphate isomerase/epimerase [Fimbriimonadaceae bacterium]
MPAANRRTFLATSAAFLAASRLRAAAGLKRAVIVGKPTLDNLKPIKEAGFDGVEGGVVSVDEAKAAREAAASLGLQIHSVIRGWASFNSANPADVEKTFNVTVDALKAAQAYGADAVLLVPCRIGAKMPQPWELNIKFDPATGKLLQVVDGDNAPWADYIAQADHAWTSSVEQVKKLIPYAEQCGVTIALENVWNNLWTDPRHFAALVDACGSPWVKVYFDLGNHIKFGKTETWLEALGQRSVKLHVKDFKLNPDGHGGDWANIRDGSNNWPSIRRTIEAIGYQGWLTIEGGNLSLQEHRQRLDAIIAGQ